MSPKPPTKGPFSVDIHPRPRPPSDGHTPLPDTLPRVDFGSPVTTSPRNPSRTTGTPGDGDLDAITPAPTVTASELPSVPVPAPAVAPRSLERYWVASAAQLPAPDAQGIRTLKGRQYVDVPGGGIVHVEADPDTGLYLYRAKLPRELQASGPMLVRDPASTLWHPVDEVGSTTYPVEAQVPFHRRIAERALVKSYFAEATDQHADDFIAHFGDKDKAEAELKRLQLGFPHLDREVRAWERAYKGIDDDKRIRRLAIGSKIRRLYKWQGETLEQVHRDGRMVGFKLELDLGHQKNQTLPIFSTRLSSIVSLHLKGGVVQKLGRLIAGFSHIETLEVHMSGLIELPAEIDRLTELRVLNLSGTRFVLGPANVERFTSLTRLQELNLEKCVLQLAPSVRGMTELRVLKLGYNEIRELPAGLNQLPGPSRLQVLDLHRNIFLDVAPDITAMSELRVLDLTITNIKQLPVGLGTAGGPSRLEVLRLGNNAIGVAPSLIGMTELRELDLSSTGIDRFPEGVTSEIPKTILDLSHNSFASIPEDIEIRKGFKLRYNPITDPATLRRLIFARRQTGTDVWLADFLDADVTANLWLRNVPQDQIPDKLALWDRVFPVSEGLFTTERIKIRELSTTPEFLVERQILQRRVWTFLERFAEADQSERMQLTEILRNEPSPGQMLDKLEEELRKYDAGRQNQPPHHLPKRPRLE